LREGILRIEEIRPYKDGMRACFRYLCACVLVAIAIGARGDVVVRRVQGKVKVSKDSRSWKSLREGRRIPIGWVIRTGTNAVVDLELTKSDSILRLMPGSTFAVETDSKSEGSDAEAQIDLKEGRLLAVVEQATSASKFEIKTPVGVAGIRSAAGNPAEFDITSRGVVRVARGTVVVGNVTLCTHSEFMVVHASQSARPNDDKNDCVSAIVENLDEAALVKLKQEIANLKKFAPKIGKRPLAGN
jgi:hypothetical protein